MSTPPLVADDLTVRRKRDSPLHARFFNRPLRVGGDRRQDVAAVEAGLALLGIGRELIRVRDGAAPTPAAIAVGTEVARFLGNGRSLPLERARRAASEGAAGCLATLRDGELGVTDARAAARAMVALVAMRDGLERCAGIFPAEGANGATAHAA